MRKHHVYRVTALVLGLGGAFGWFSTRVRQTPEAPIATAHVDTSEERKESADSQALVRSDERFESAHSRAPTESPPVVRIAPGISPRNQPVPSTVHEAARTFRQGQNNAFFDEAAFARSFTRNGERGVEKLRKELRNTESLEKLPEDVHFFKDAPEEVLDRMSMIDMLGTIAKDDPSALDALVEIACSPIDPKLPPQVIRALVGEKYDAFVELARHDWKVASSAFAKLENDKLKEAMRPALMGGLVDSGMPNEEALLLVQAI